MKKRAAPVGPVATLDAPRPPRAGVSPGTILIVCDDASEARAVSDLISAEGWTPRLAAGGEDAVKILAGARTGGPPPPALVVAGFPLGGPWGRLVMESAGAGTGVPLLALVPAGAGAQEAEDLGARADGMIVRPLHGAALLKQVRSLAALRRLEAEVEESRRSSRTSEDRLAAARAERSELGHRVAHDLGNPLTGILGHAQMLQQRCRGAVPEVDRYAGRILKAARQMQQILADVRDLGLLEEGRMALRPEKVDLHAVIRSVVDDYRDAAAAEGVKVDLEPGRTADGDGSVVVCVDPGLLLRVVGNFLADAVRHTPPDGTVRIHVAPPADGRVEVHLSDMAAEALEEVHGRGGESDPGAGPARSPRPERGLRLAFCRAALAVHGGRMWVKPNAAGGDTLGFLLPVECPEAPCPER
jgi:signal transduction histidine kinase